jgi:translation initiation factor 3 subunit C
VKSQRDKAWEGLQDGITRTRNARRNGDWPLVQDEFGNVNKMLEKSKMLIVKSGIPNFYIKMLVEVEDSVQAALKDKEAVKKMKAVVMRALNQMKLQVKKHNDGHKEQIADCRANPAKYQDEEEESESEESASDSDGDSDSDESEKPKKKVERKVAMVSNIQ